jgi:hypothetical protein
MHIALISLPPLYLIFPNQPSQHPRNCCRRKKITAIQARIVWSIFLDYAE